MNNYKRNYWIRFAAKCASIAAFYFGINYFPEIMFGICAGIIIIQKEEIF